ncbi:MAG: glycerophosphodiester phosphodiesterase family protein [Paludisphaera borealis]|uniref:glycerophosphodiester phosphodiesterase n=1 Tax=Paludisphaera borealis TaxID=1387353 RepID=UPI00283EFE81|nr:glycerophosphodiester phosphodiesterase family protein [Paludisphaera borealis]MDR3620072.1 glycerophosphodiester phosphodiesterase family protein [Paludisphaera borealis]
MSSLACLLLLAATGQAPSAGGFPFFEPVQPPRPLQVMARRGAMGLAPENTAPALEASIADTVEWVEVDVRLTGDGHHVLFHDDVLDHKTDATGRVRESTLAEVRAADAGSPFARRFAGQRVLTLTEALNLARGRVNLYLDCKDVDPARLAREVLAAKMERQVVVYGEPAALQAVRAEAGEAVALMAKWQPRFGIDAWVGEVRPHAVEIDAEDVTSDVCRDFHRRGIKVQAKAVGGDDRPEVWDRVAAAGVDWLQTDRAEEVLARQALKAIRPGGAKVAHHRGASHYVPENTLEALKKSVALGADFVEFDIRTTRDGAFVLIHDSSLDRTTTGRGPVRDRTSGEVAALDAGSWFGRPFSGLKVPTLDAFLDAVAPLGVGLYVDAKDIPPEALAEALERHGLTDRAVVYQGAAYLERLKTIAPALRRMPPLRDPSELDALAERVRPYAVDANWAILSKPLIDRCHALGIKVFSDALGSHETVEHYQRAVRDGLDVIQTNHPVLVLRALALIERSAPARP